MQQKSLWYTLLVFSAMLSATSAQGQEKLEWCDSCKLRLTDFQAATTRIGNTNVYSLYSGSQIDFAYAMNSYAFMATKNFNSKVTTLFSRPHAAIIAPDEEIAHSLLAFAQYDFDLAELHSRKLRKKLYESKGAFSSADFYKPAYDEVHKEYVERNGFAAHETDMGRDAKRLKVLHDVVLEEIEGLADFCKTCKPPKKKK